MRQIRMDTRWLDGGYRQSDMRQDFRRHWERLLNRSKYLDKRERVLLETAIEQGGSVRRLAQLTCRSPSGVRRQIRDIIRRLSSCELQAMLAEPAAFSELEKACLREHLIRKQPLARVAEQLDASVYRVRKTLAAARAKARRLSAVTQKAPKQH